MITVKLNDIIVSAKHGVYEEEHFTPQRFKINISMNLNDAVSAESDKLADTVDYKILRDKVCEIAKGEHINLMETLAEKIATVVMNQNKVQEATIEISKLDAWGGGDAGYPSVVLRKSR